MSENTEPTPEPTHGHTPRDPRDADPTRDGGLGSETFDTDQLQPEDSLVGTGEQDPLDAGYTPPERLQRASGWGTTPAEQQQDETIDQRIGQEEPDPAASSDALDDEGGLGPEAMAGGEDPDAIPASEDVLGDDPAPLEDAAEASRAEFVTPEAGDAPERTDGLVADEVPDVDVDTAEEAAMHVTDAEGVDRP